MLKYVIVLKYQIKILDKTLVNLKDMESAETTINANFAMKVLLLNANWKII